MKIVEKDALAQGVTPLKQHGPGNLYEAAERIRKACVT
jgi:hypothetical protein